MQQLTLQFDGYADSRPVIDVSTTKQCNGCSHAGNVVFPRWKQGVPMAGTMASLRAWLDAKSEIFTALCGSEGDVFTHGDVVKAHLYMAAVLILIGIGGAL